MVLWVNTDSMAVLQEVVPPEVMLPERRLEVLVGQALQSQLASCPFHNAQPAAISLLHDFQCGREQIPTCTTQVQPSLASASTHSPKAHGICNQKAAHFVMPVQPAIIRGGFNATVPAKTVARAFFKLLRL